MTIHRVHDIAGLKKEIKRTSVETRNARTKARKLTGLDRHEALCWARDPNIRNRLLAYGYLRGRTIREMESEYTRPDNFPDVGSILYEARPYFNQGPDATEHPASWEDFRTMVREDVQQWKAHCLAQRVIRSTKKAIQSDLGSHLDIAVSL